MVTGLGSTTHECVIAPAATLSPCLKVLLRHQRPAHPERHRRGEAVNGIMGSLLCRHEPGGRGCHVVQRAAQGHHGREGSSEDSGGQIPRLGSTWVALVLQEVVSGSSAPAVVSNQQCLLTC